jgi:hypothetical protein
MFKTLDVLHILDNSILTSISINPNPINENSFLNINLLQASNLSIHIYDINGNEIQNIFANGSEGTNSIELNKNLVFASGTYRLLVFANGKLVGTAQFVVNK